MINAKQAKTNAEYYHSEKRKEDIRASIFNKFIDYLSNEIDESSSIGKYSITEKLKNNIRIWDAFIEDKEEVEHIGNYFKEKGFTVNVEYHNDDIRGFNTPCETDKTPVMTISWDE